MSLRGRLLLVMVLLNLAALAVVQAVSVVIQEAWRERYLTTLEAQYQNMFPGFLSAVYRPDDDGLATETVKRILDTQGFHYQFRDVLITQGKSLSGGAVDLNPLGCSHRDLQTFPLEQIRSGIRRAMGTRQPVQIGGGVCVPILVDDQVVAGAWAETILPNLPPLPFWGIALPIFGSILVFGLLAGWIITRTVGRPLQSLSEAARRLGAGDYEVRVPAVATAPELRVLEGTFNSMADKVEGHKTELESEVQRATEEAKENERALVRSSRLAAIGTLAAGIAHEVNNPIGGMLNAVHRLIGQPGQSERDRVYLELIQDGLQRIGGTARKMLDFSPQRSIQAVEFSLISAVQSARALVEHRVQHQGVQWHIEIPEELPSLIGDPTELQQVFLNLFLNALDVMAKQPDGRIRVAARVLSQSHVRVQVEDNGPGVDKETLERVLDPFFTGKSDPEATGLGLFICHAIVQNHGGDLRLDSEPGRGFLVELDLPIVRRQELS